jgi:hypothetical protein
MYEEEEEKPTKTIKNKIMALERLNHGQKLEEINSI